MIIGEFLLFIKVGLLSTISKYFDIDVVQTHVQYKKKIIKLSKFKIHLFVNNAW